MQMYAIVASLMTGKLFRLLQACEVCNGYLAWKRISTEMEPSSRSRTLALLQGLLGTIAWSDSIDYTEQLYTFERSFRHYEQAAQKD